MDSPCLTCTRVKNPRDCENKSCKAWSMWFLYEWAKIQSRFNGSVKEEVETDNASK
jgi:hypothetical protein